jgi:hypothetical protein
MKPTVVQLEGGAEGSEITFEQAFGQYSEVRGRQRGRRQKRKLDRIAKRREARKARQEALAEKMRTRQARLTERKQSRLARKEMGKEEEEEPAEDSATPTEDGATDSGSTDGGQAPPINQEGDSVQDNQGGGQGEYQGEGGGYSADDEGQNPEGADAVVDSETGESDEESGFTGDSNFDGAIMLSPEDVEWNDYFSSAEGVKRINPKVRQLSLAIEKEKDLIAILKKRSIRLSGSKSPMAQKNLAILSRRIENHTERLSRMESKLASYSRFEGDYSEARGGKRGVAKRKAEVRHAKKYARKLRKNALRKRRRNKSANTQVEEGLEPEFSSQMIEVPAERSNFNGTGLIGLDEQGDIDAPETRKFDLIFSNAEGDEAKKKKRKKLIIGISVGVAVGVLAIVLIKKFGKK